MAGKLTKIQYWRTPSSFYLLLEMGLALHLFQHTDGESLFEIKSGPLLDSKATSRTESSLDWVGPIGQF